RVQSSRRRVIRHSVAHRNAPPSYENLWLIYAVGEVLAVGTGFAETGFVSLLKRVCCAGVGTWLAACGGTMDDPGGSAAGTGGASGSSGTGGSSGSSSGPGGSSGGSSG